MINADQLFVHAIGDYLTQSDWMAQNKTKTHFPAFCHALVYSLGFLAFRPSLTAWLVIIGTHFLIDRYRLARYIVWAKNFLAPESCWKLMKSTSQWVPMSNQDHTAWRTWIDHCESFDRPAFMEDVITVQRCRMLPFSDCAATGYPPSTPAWISVWLMIIADNILHVAINGAALKWL